MMNFKVDVNRYAQFLDASIGINGIDKKKATSPKSLLERVINFVTLGALHKRFSAEYDNFKAALTQAIEERTQDIGGYTLPDDLTLVYDGHRVTFTPEPHGAKDAPQMRVEVEGTLGERISRKRFNNFCTMQLLMKNTPLCEADISLTEQGMLDLKRANLSALPLTGIDLSYADLREANFANADLKGANLQGAWCQEAKFNGANLQEAFCQEAKFNGANMVNVDFKGANLQRALCQQAKLNGANLQGTLCQGAELQGANLQGAMCQKDDMAGADLRDIEIAETDCLLKQIKETADKKLTEDISALCDKIKKAYKKKSNAKVSPDGNGLFRVPPEKAKLNEAEASLHSHRLDIENVDLKIAGELIKREFKASKPLDQQAFNQLMSHPARALQLLLDRFDNMPAEMGRRCRMILSAFADAYNNADDDDVSQFNKETVLSCAADTSIFSEFFAFTKENSTTTRHISERILNDVIQYQRTHPNRHHSELAGPASSALESRFLTTARVDEAIDKHRATLAKSLNADEDADLPAPRANILSKGAGDILAQDRRADEGASAAPPQTSTFFTEVVSLPVLGCVP
ncbi:pentapeptide repeat-containing protein [Sodalis sp. (in: enterobacteria)]|uniref:pentapeptide repeat-containing protein n=1 Tax=Sodalis sp. (in: enterobacteria) TaxID=1898979 RepID=UPI003F392D63